jgi:hydroxymethylbilane synthase
LEIETIIVRTRGDRWAEKNDGTPAPGKGLFTAELEEALLAGEIDLAVHSLKDLPTALHPGLVIAAIPARGDARDALALKSGASLDDVPPGWTIATGSPRRRAQLLRARPDLAPPADIRGNIDSRLRKLRENSRWAGILLAQAGLDRLRPDLTGLSIIPLSLEVMLPAPGQGALALQTRADDARSREWLTAIHHDPTAREVEAERSFLDALGGGCSSPAGACATFDGKGCLRLRAIAWLDGESTAREGMLTGEPSDAAGLGIRLANTLRTHVPS